MYSVDDELRVLEKNLKYELDIVRFYMSNLDKLNYAKNKKGVSTLVLESMDHAKMIVAEMLLLKKNVGGKISDKHIVKALKEETGAKEIYKYELMRTKDPLMKKMLLELIREEEKHEKIVKALK